MTEQEVIQKLKFLKQIKPNKEWAILAKQEIIDNNSAVISNVETLTITEKFVNIISEFRFNFLKPALAPVVCFGLLFGFFNIYQNALPGDLLFSAKKITEQAQINLTPEKERSKIELELTTKRWEELVIVANENKGENLASAILEVEQATKKSTDSVAEKKDITIEEAELAIKEVEKIKALENEIKSTGVYADKSLIEDLEEAIESYYIVRDNKTLAEQEIQDLQNSSFGYTPEQEQQLEEIIQLFEQERYSQALEMILLFQVAKQ